MSLPAKDKNFVNRLAKEKSPYLLQHAHNPVDWYPWGEEAFKTALDSDKPILLSIGYATCHWCHVMEKESFENEDIARLLNETFINIKVDREELPEVDNIYMEFAQALMPSAGGWPLNVVLTPDLKPFFAVTYLPPKSRRNLLGMDAFAKHMKELWQSEHRMEIVEQANKMVELVERSSVTSGDEMPTALHISNAVEVIFAHADPVYGGTKSEPKFPLGYQAEFLLQYAQIRNESRALFYVELTLDGMSRGGIYDHLGGGFSRYSIDERWEVPHFEKMLYDNAILSKAYLEAWKLTKKPSYLQVVQETLGYICRDMAAPEGGFYSAEDADTEGHEGRFYTWTLGEIKEVLPAEDAVLFCQFYGVMPAGNFEGRNVLHVDIPLEEFADAVSIPALDLSQKLSQLREMMFKKREQRQHPFKDDKIITAWNGLAIDVLIKASRDCQNPLFKEKAVSAAQFIKKHLWSDGRLLRRFREGDARFSATLEDYAFLVKGVLSLHEEGCGQEYLDWGVRLAECLEKNFKAPRGAFYQTDGKEPLIIRKCEYYDGAEPSGNAVHSENLLRLFQLTGIDGYLTQAEDIFRAAKSYIEAVPQAASYHLMSLQKYLNLMKPRENL